MRDWTYTELKAKVMNDLDLQNETSISDTEYLGLFNEAIDEAEAEIHKLGVEEEYFLDSDTLSLITSTSEYSMPAAIYANKIRAIIYSNGSDIFEVRRHRGKNKFLDVSQIDYENTNAQNPAYRYFVTNNLTNNRKIRLVPASKETSTNMRVWFIRNARRLTTGADILDIPEFTNFVLSFVKVRLLQKEGDARVELEAEMLKAQRKLMIDTLTEMVPDGDTEVERDLSHYEEHE